MIIGIVRGSVYSTINHPFYDGRRMLIVERTEADWTPTKGYVIALDTVDAGVGDHVLVNNEGNGARQVFNDPKGAVRSVITGIVDHVDEVGG